MNYLLIPGNPPARHFYDLWAQEIELHHPGSHAQVGVYPDLPLTSDSRQAMNLITDSLTQQLKDFHHQVQAPVIILGHSLGAHFALKMLEQSGDLVQAVGLLHPFLRRPQWRGRMILDFVSALSVAPRIPQTLVKSRRGLDLISAELPFVSDAEILNSFQIARHEKVTIGRDQTPLRISAADRARVFAFYCDEDIWCGSQVIRELEEQIPTQKFSAPHGFITERRYRDQVFTAIHRTGIAPSHPSAVEK